MRNKIECDDNIMLLKTNNKIEYDCKLMLLKMRIKIDKIATKALFNVEKLCLKLMFLDLRCHSNKLNTLFISSLSSNERLVLCASVLFETSNDFKRDANER